MHPTNQESRGVLFICTGNICRSPMAAGLFERRVNARIVRSAGTHGVDGQPVHPLALEVMQRKGVDLSTHRAQTVTPQLLMASDLILVMEAKHRTWIESKLPAVCGRVELLGLWWNLEILDPVNGGPTDFECAAEDIDKCIRAWSQFLLKGLQPVMNL